MSTELIINAITDGAVRKAAEVADGDLSGKVEENEISCFLREAVKKGCNDKLVMQCIGTTPVFSNERANNKFATYQEISQLKTKIKEKEEEYNRMLQKYNKMQGSKTRDTSAKVGTVTGGLAGLGIAGYIVFGAGVAASGPLGWIAVAASGLTSALGCSLIGLKVGEIAGEKLESHDEKIAQSNKDKFHDEVLTKAWHELNALKDELSKKLEQFVQA